MISRTVTVRNEAGIHCRPSAIIIKSVQGFEGVISVSCGSDSCDPRSILGLMSMGLEKGRTVEIQAEGEGDADLADTLVELFERHYDFQPKGQ